MPKPISIALVYSIAIHLALFLIADSLLRARTQPAMVSTPLVVSIESPQTTNGLAENRLVVPEPETVSPHPAETSRANNPPDDPSVIQTATDTGSARVQTDSEKFAVADVVATTAIAEWVAVVTPPDVAPPTPSKAAISSSQEEMVSRKLLEWSDKLHEMPDMASVLKWNDKGQDYVARFSELPGADDMAFERVLVEISTEQDGKRLSSEAQFKRLAFSNYAHFVNRWDPETEIFNDELDGRFHSNTRINIAYDRKVQPLFLGEVTTASSNVNFTRRQGTTTRDQIFLGGLQTGVRRIEFPGRFSPFLIEEGLSEDQVHRFAEDTRITFQADGTFVWQTLNAEAPEQTGALSAATTYLIADEKAGLHIKGTVNGKVLVYSPERIVIEDDLVYARNPEESRDADDYVGLVSDKNVVIAPPEVTGRGDLVINAAIYAKRRFAVRRFRARGRALLHLYGSLSAGSISATEPRYYTRIKFDHRLENLRPPGFPLTDEYEVESWDAAWSVEPSE